MRVVVPTYVTVAVAHPVISPVRAAHRRKDEPSTGRSCVVVTTDGILDLDVMYHRARCSRCLDAGPDQSKRLWIPGSSPTVPRRS